MALPPLGGVFSIRETSSLKTFALPTTEPLELVTAEHAQALLTREYATDAHFCVYYPSTTASGEDDSFPRLAKTALAEIRQQGADLLQAWWLAELDNPGHLPHASPKQATARLLELWTTLSPAPHMAYTTRAGYRFGWALQRPLPVDESEQRRATFVNQVLPDADPNTKDWTHLWRVPKATRDHTSQWLQPWFQLHLADDTTRTLVDPDDYEPAAAIHPPPRAALTGVTPRPTNEEAEDILDVLYNQQDRYLESELKRRIQGRLPLEAVAFRHAPIAPPNGPGRSTAIHKLAGQAAGFWTSLAPRATPELVYAVLWPQLMQLEPDPATPCWLDHAWIAIQTYWQRELANAPRSGDSSGPGSTGGYGTSGTPSLKQTIERQSSLLGSMLEGMRTWALPDFPADFDSQCLYAQKRLILVTQGAQGEWYLLRPDGYYSPWPVNRDSLIPRIRQLGLESLIPLSTMDNKPRTPESIVRDYATPIRNKHMRVGILGAQGHPGGILHQQPGEDEISLHLSYFSRRTDVLPQFDHQVDEWLRALAGSSYPDLTRWLSYALDFEGGPICALAIHGAPSIGKTMLSQGLAEAISPRGYATGADFGKYGEGLVRSPFLFIDEGFLSHVPVADRANRFRTLVDGSPQTIEQKYQAKIQIRNPIRAIFMSNNGDFVDDLTGGRELTAYDREAIARRMLLVQGRQEAAVHLEARGGLSYTNGWVDAASGEPGQSRVARHILHLYATRHQQARDSRFLVEGRTDEGGILRQLETRSESAEVVTEALLEMVEAVGSSRPPSGLVYRRGHEDGEDGVFVTSTGVLEHLRRAVAQRRMERVPSRKKITQILARFSFMIGKRIAHNDGSRYAHLNLEELLRVARETGHEPTTVLEALIEKRAAATQPPQAHATAPTRSPLLN